MSWFSDWGAKAVDQTIDVASSVYSARQAEENQKRSLRDNRRARSHQENMYKHRFQWQMEDMKKAGLNPILAASQSPGGASSSSAGAAASGAPPAVKGRFNEMALLQAQKDAANSASKLNDANKAKTDIQTAIDKAWLDIVQDPDTGAMIHAASKAGKIGSILEGVNKAKDTVQNDTGIGTKEKQKSRRKDRQKQRENIKPVSQKTGQKRKRKPRK